MFNNILQRKNFSIRRNATKRWKQAQSGQKQDTGDNSNNDNSKPASALRQQKSLTEPLSVVIVKTSMNLDQQKQAVEIVNIALDTLNLESEISTSIKKQMDEFTGQTWHVVVGRNFGMHSTWASLKN